MNYFHLCYSLFLLCFCLGCAPDLCLDVECGPGYCAEGICDCPDGFEGANCEIALCFGTPCMNGDCDTETESCNCNPNFYGDECNILCANGAYVNGNCNCNVGFEGLTCETESRDRFLGWWGCQEWSYTSQIGGTQNPGFWPASIKFECNQNIPEIEFFPTENSNGLMLLKSSDRIVGQVKEKIIYFESQYLTTEVRVNGSARLGNDQILSFELHFFNTATLSTQIARGTFALYRNISVIDCI